MKQNDPIEIFYKQLVAEIDSNCKIKDVSDIGITTFIYKSKISRKTFNEFVFLGDEKIDLVNDQKEIQQAIKSFFEDAIQDDILVEYFSRVTLISKKEICFNDGKYKLDADFYFEIEISDVERNKRIALKAI